MARSNLQKIARRAKWEYRIKDAVPEWIRCHIFNKHRVKLGSYGRCIRCGKKVV